MIRGLDRNSARAVRLFARDSRDMWARPLFELPDVIEGGLHGGIPFLAGAVTAALSGYASIALFLRFLRRGSLRGFAVYTWIAGILALWLAQGL